MVKNINEIYKMLAMHQDDMVYMHTKKGSREYQHLETIRSLIEAIDVEGADETDNLAELEKYYALEAAWQALYREYEIKEHEYVKEVIESAEFKRYIDENGYAY